MVHDARVSSDGAALVCAIEDEIDLVEAASFERIRREKNAILRGGVGTVALSADRRIVAKVVDHSLEDGSTSVILIDIERGEEIATLQDLDLVANATHSHGGLRIQFSPDVTTLFTGSTALGDPTLKVWDVASKKLLLSVPLHGHFNDAAFSPDGTRLVIAESIGKAAMLYEVGGIGIRNTMAYQAQGCINPNDFNQRPLVPGSIG